MTTKDRDHSNDAAPNPNVQGPKGRAAIAEGEAKKAAAAQGKAPYAVPGEEEPTDEATQEYIAMYNPVSAYLTEQHEKANKAE